MYHTISYIFLMIIPSSYFLIENLYDVVFFHLSDSWLSYLSFINSRNLSRFIPSINFYRNRTSQSFCKYIPEKDGIELQIFPCFLFENFKGIGILSCFIKNRNILSQLEIRINLKYFLQCILNKNLEHREGGRNKK